VEEKSPLIASLLLSLNQNAIEIQQKHYDNKAEGVNTSRSYVNTEENHIKKLMGKNNRHEIIIDKLKHLFGKAQEYGEKQSIIDLQW